MEIQTLAIEKVIPYIRNPRKNENAVELSSIPNLELILQNIKKCLEKMKPNSFWMINL